MFLVGGAFFAMWYFLTFYFQRILGYGPVKAGFAFLPMALAIIAGAQISSRLFDQDRRAAAPAGRGSTLATLGIPVDRPSSSRTAPTRATSWPRRSTCAFAMGLLFTPLATAATVGRRPGRRGPRLGRPQHRPPGRRLAVARRPRHRRGRPHRAPSRIRTRRSRSWRATSGRSRSPRSSPCSRCSPEPGGPRKTGRDGRDPDGRPAPRQHRSPRTATLDDSGLVSHLTKI